MGGRGSPRCVVRLLGGREDVEADLKDNGSQTPLWTAAEGGHDAIVMLLGAKLSDGRVG
jgi:hypothetical protein